MSSRARLRANSAGYWKTEKGSPPDSSTLLPQTENAAPMTGPRRNPQEKAMPITAYIRQRVCVCMCVRVHKCGCTHVCICA